MKRNLEQLIAAEEQWRDAQGSTMNEKQTANGIFRDKSLERVSSPEALNDYIRVTTPSVWIVLIALVCLLAGMLAWSIFGTVEVHSEDGSTEKIAPITYVMN
jgi:hypothetical protein